MRYLGGKHRLAKHLLKVMLPGHEGTWIEPFVGSASVIQHVPARYKRVGADLNPYIIQLHIALQNGWTPPTSLTNEEWRAIRYNKANYEPALVAFAGFGCSYGARWFEGYARSPKTPHINHAAATARNLEHMRPLLTGIDFYCCNYADLVLPLPPATIYCDPPYRGTTKYSGMPKFDNDLFWRWATLKARQGYRVFVSEFTAPEGWQCVWEKERATSLTKDTGAKKGVERLFIHTGLADEQLR